VIGLAQRRRPFSGAHRRRSDRGNGVAACLVSAGLRDLGRALGFDVWVASNDVGRPYAGGRLGDGCLSSLPAAIDDAPGRDAVRLIDVLWPEPDTGHVAGAFEVEHTTSIYSGIVRLLDLALGSGGGAVQGLFLVAPDGREDDVRAQLARPAFSRVADLRVRFLPYGELGRHRESIARFGHGMRPIEALAKVLT
jgi:type II restriction enzyme